MAQKTSSFERFWKELKRRNVIQVITAYAAVSFIILQLVDIIAQPLQLPAWTLQSLIILLFLGFVIVAVFSWIYDINSGRVKKTKSLKSDKGVHIYETSKAWKIISYVSIVIIFVLISFNIFSRKKSEDISKLEKSIAVLPFRNDSSSDSTTYFIDGLMEEILNSLQKIGAFSRVLSRNSVEQYRNNTSKSTPEIAKELGVNYIIEGSGQKYGNIFRLRVQLVETSKDRHIWAESYEQEIKETKDIFKIQSQVAHSIAAELKTTITPEEKQLIEKTPTLSLTAYDFSQRGKEEYVKFWIDNNNRGALGKAEDFYHKALEYDSSFAEAYCGLAKIYWIKDYYMEYFSNNFLDSALVLADVALSIDDQLSEAYYIRGGYYSLNGDKKRAIEEYDKAIKYNSNEWRAYWGKGFVYENDDIVKEIDNFQTAASLNHGPELPEIIRYLAASYAQGGFWEKAKYYLLEAFKLDGDSIPYLSRLEAIENQQGNYEKAIELNKRLFAIDSTQVSTLMYIGLNNAFLGQNEESLRYYRKYIERLEVRGQLVPNNMYIGIGYAHWENGYRKEGEYYFNKQVEYSNNMIKYNRPNARLFYAYHDLAAIYAIRGEKDKAYKNLRIFNQGQRFPFWMVTLIKDEPWFDTIRSEPEFQKIAKDVKAKYQAEHERVKKWLEEQGML
jgi:TolB-like protein/Tfp pilus assembly protein PilF